MNTRKLFVLFILFVSVLTVSFSPVNVHAYVDNFENGILSSGLAYSHLIDSDGSLWAWGKNDVGQLGNGTTVNRLTPVQIGSSNNWSQVSTKQSHSLAIKEDGTLWAWGENGYGQLGDGTNIDRHSPVQIGSDGDWAKVTAGFSSSFGIKTDGTLWAWGRNNSGVLGDGTNIDRLSPVQVGTASDWLQIAAGGSHTVAIKSDGSLWSWGDNYYGQLGNGTYFLGDGLTSSRETPGQVGSNTNWVQVDTGAEYTVALADDGSLWMWGWDSPPQIWNGSTLTRNWPIIPEQVGTQNNWSQFSVGWFYSLAVKDDGTLWAWGDYNDGTATDHFFSPSQIGNSNEWAQAIAGATHCTALKTDGTLWSWGSNNQGTLGNGTTISSYTPIQISLRQDIDGDDVPDSSDAFPSDPAASVDTDGDGYPDNWNGGYSQLDSTTGLILDEYPSDGTKWSEAVAPNAPTLSHSMNGNNVTISWSSVDGATGYTFYYAPYTPAGPGAIPVLLY